MTVTYTYVFSTPNSKILFHQINHCFMPLPGFMFFCLVSLLVRLQYNHNRYSLHI